MIDLKLEHQKMSSCSICNAVESKYRCPNCRSPYCGISCWKRHKSQPCQPVSQPKFETESSLEYWSYKTEDTVPLNKLRLLDHNEDVKTVLRNPHVRSILKAIDASKKPNSTLSLAMLEPIFVEFVEECLKVVEPSRDEDDNVIFD